MDVPPVRYATTTDGRKIAHLSAGEGVPFLFMPPALSHIQLEWTQLSPLHGWVHALASRVRLVRYDGRGQGMSARGLGRYSLADIETDLEAVVGELALDRFVLMGSHASGHAAIRYAIEHPASLHALILPGCSVSGGSWPVIGAVELAQRNWEFFVSMFYADTAFANRPLAQRTRYVDQCVTQDDWCVMAAAWSRSEVGDRLGRLSVPTLAIHPRGYVNISPQESIAGRVSHS